MPLTKEQKVQEEICDIANNIVKQYFSYLKDGGVYRCNYNDLLPQAKSDCLQQIIIVLKSLRDRGYVVINTFEW